jgi:ABC-type uncharacterized transport system ATPase subunit
VPGPHLGHPARDLLLDEPTSVQGVQPMQVFENTARDLAAQGITII